MGKAISRGACRSREVALVMSSINVQNGVNRPVDGDFSNPSLLKSLSGFDLLRPGLNIEVVLTKAHELNDVETQTHRPPGTKTVEAQTDLEDSIQPCSVEEPIARNGREVSSEILGSFAESIQKRVAIKGVQNHDLPNNHHKKKGSLQRDKSMVATSLNLKKGAVFQSAVAAPSLSAAFEANRWLLVVIALLLWFGAAVLLVWSILLVYWALDYVLCINKTIDRYQTNAKDLGSSNNVAQENLQHLKEEAVSLSEKIELLQVSKRKLLGDGLESSCIDELQEVQDQIEQSLSKIRARKTQVFKEKIEQLKEEERILTEENAKLREKLKCNQMELPCLAFAQEVPTQREISDVETELFIGPPDEQRTTRWLIQSSTAINGMRL
ncbi:MADS-box protein SOC1 [Camellia lanceoleosa]|uniref:MADS-box protein SOC1 n=1 Tax=Camellia lanceoleosa TaxID=1840588 RepID=A0ACC0FIB1_9ERIC|nr:MADS-box protein SOC1 [Camellia lanceoleosa]